MDLVGVVLAAVFGLYLTFVIAGGLIAAAAIVGFAVAAKLIEGSSTGEGDD